MTYSIRLPDGTLVENIPDEVTPEAAKARILQFRPDLGTDTSKAESGFIPALKSGWAGLKGDIAAVAGRTGIMDEAAAEKYRAEQEAYQKQTFKPTEKGWTEAPVAKTLELLGQSVPYMAAPLAAGIVAPAGLPALGAAGAASALQFTGSNLSRQTAEGKKLSETDLGAAAVAALPQAALDMVSFKMLPGIRQIFSKAGVDLSEEAAKNIAAQGLKKTAFDYGASTAKTMGSEGLTEAGQQVLERMQAGLNITDEKARAEYWDSLVGGAILGGVLAPAGRYVERGKEQAAYDAQQAKLAMPAIEEQAPPPAEEEIPAAPTIDELILQREALKQQPPSSETRQQIQALSKQITEMGKARSAEETQRMREAKTPLPSDMGAGPAAKSAAVFTSEQGEIPMPRERVVEPLPPETDLFGEPVKPKPEQPEGLADVISAELPPTTEVLQDAGLAPTRKELEAAGQQAFKMPLVPLGEGKLSPKGAPQAPLPAGVPEPTLRAPKVPVTPDTVPTLVGDDTFKALGIGPTAVIRKSPLVGMDIAKPEDAAQVKRDLTTYRDASKSDRIKANIDTYLGRPEFQGLPETTPNAAPPSTEAITAKPAAKPRAGKPSVGVSSEPTAPVGAAPTPTGEPAAPVGRGLVPTGQPAESGVSAEGAKPAAVEGEYRDTRGGGSRFHGTKKPIGALSDDYAMSGDTRNIYGQGFYTTDALDISQGYAKKGGSQAVVYEVNHKPVKLFNMEAALDPQTEAMVQTAMGDYYPTENAETGKPLNNLREIYDEFRRESQNNNLSRDDVQDVFDSVRYNLESQGYRGFEHTGGIHTGKRAHGVKIFWSPEADVEIKPADLGRYRANAPTTKPAPALTEDEAAAQKEREDYEALQAKLAAQKDKRRGVRIAEPVAPKEEQPAVAEVAPLTVVDAARKRLQTAYDAGGIDIGDYARLQEQIESGDAAGAMREMNKTAKENLGPEARFSVDTTPSKAAEAASPTSTATKESEHADTPEPTAAKAMEAIEGKPLIEVAQWAVSSLPKGYQKLIAQRVLQLMKQVEKAGITFMPLKITGDGKRLSSGARGVTVLDAKRNERGATISITLNHPSNGDQGGVNPVTVLHELVHAATMSVIQLGQYKSNAGSALGAKTRELMKLQGAVIDHFNQRIASKAELTPFETAIYNRSNNALADMDELLAWGLTSPDMQTYLESIPYQGTTIWNKFVTMIRDMLGLPAKADTALAELLRVSDSLFGVQESEIEAARVQSGFQYETTKRNQIDYTTMDLIKNSGAVDEVEKGVLRKWVDIAKADPGIDYTTKFRTQVADIAATIESRLTKQFDGAVRDSMGKLNPMGLYRQAQDYTKMLLSYFQQGTLVKDTDTGLWRVTKSDKVRPPAEVYAKLKEWGKANGWSMEQATQIASRILEGVRLNEMRIAKKRDQADLIIHKIDEKSALSADQQIDKMMQAYKSEPALQEISKLMDEARIALVDHMVAVGRLTKEQGQDWREISAYVPFDRLSPEVLQKFSSAKRTGSRGLAQIGKLPELRGTTRLAVGNVFDNYINTLGWMVGQIVKTDATVRTLRSLEKVGGATHLGPNHGGSDRTVGMYVKGVMNYWELPSKYDVMAFKDLNAPKAGWLLQMGAFSNWLRKSITALPPFALKQVTDDVQRAIMTSGVKNPAALLRMSLANFGKYAMAELRGIEHPDVAKFGAMGLTGEYDFEAGKPASSLLKDLGYKPRGKFGTLMHRLDGITRASDLAVRKAIYDQSMKETNDDVLLSQTRAREFINFRRRGNSAFVGAMVTTIPFFNAYVQGMDVLYRAASGKDSSSSVGRAQARRMFWQRAAILTTMASVYALGKDDDDEVYKEMDLRTRDSNWIIGGAKIAVPGEIGAIFKVIPERVVEYMKRQGTPEEQTAWEATRTALAYIFEQYGGRVTPVPQAVKPLLEAWGNKSFLTGRPLEGFHHGTMDPSMRVTEGTSELAKAIANFSKDAVGVEVSPIMIDNALRGYFGSTAALVTTVTDSLLNPTRVDRPLHKWALLSNYMFDPIGNRRMTEFYEERESMSKANSTLNELMKTDMSRAEAYAEAHQDELVFEKYINSTLNELEKTRAYRKFLNSPDGAKEMSADDREAQLKEIKQFEMELVGWLREAKTEYAKSR